ncbi:hypothetical protein HOD38_03475 [archaeon]|nr:hypothetical protein [archaeon]MBT4397301.1 hypothetical protein [archaeon]MBT4440681.1 hypothetical protein [archaeon]
MRPNPKSTLMFGYYTHENGTQYGFEIMEMRLLPNVEIYYPAGQRGGSGRFRSIEELVDAMKHREGVLISKGHVVARTYVPGLSSDVLRMAPDAELPSGVDIADFEFFLSEYEGW